MHIAKWNKSIWKNYILSDSKYMTFWKIHWDSETTELGKKKKDEYLGEGTKGEQVNTKEF